jgi:hypothetical protein
MTTFAENQLDFHREKYYSLSSDIYSRIMTCYEQPRMTNEETDKCAATYRQYMQNKQEEMTKSLMNKCKSLEVCTDRCKGEEDMQCINKCGSTYLRDLHTDFDTRLKRYCTEV